MDQEQKRQLNARVAEALGYEITSGEIDNVNPLYNNGHRLKEMDFSGSWAWAGLLIEKAREKGIYLDPSHYPEGWRVDALKLDDDGIMSLMVTPIPVLIASLPLATCLSFLKAQYVDITPYIQAV